MRLLVDANLAPRVAELLTAAGHDVRHVFDIGLGSATDSAILASADADGRVVVSSDTDFGALLARQVRASLVEPNRSHWPTRPVMAQRSAITASTYLLAP